jgi:DNA primase
VENAQDFFDYWIEREVATKNLNSLGTKTQLARTLAETIGRVRDPLMRGQVISKASARLGVPAADFENLVPKTFRARPTQEDRAVPTVAPAPRHDVAMLCLLALRDAEARDFLLAQNWRDVVGQTPGSEILVHILESDLRPNDPASINAFMTTLTAEEEALVSWWLREEFKDRGGEIQERLPRAMRVAEGSWNKLRQSALQRQLQIVEGRMKLPRLTTGEEVNLQKQILDLREQLREISQFSSARVLDS